MISSMVVKEKLVILPQRVHLFPFRTQKLSSAEATILAWRRAGKIAQCQHFMIQLIRFIPRLAVSFFIPRWGSPHEDIYSSLAQSVEHLTVNQGVVGSSPTGGAKNRSMVADHALVFAFLSWIRPRTSSIYSQQPRWGD